MEDDLDSLSAIVVAFYLFAVFYHGNATKLAADLSGERKYLEFCLASFLIYYIVKYDKTGLAAPLAALFGLAWLLRLSGKFDIVQVTQDFADGKTSLFDAIKNGLNKVN